MKIKNGVKSGFEFIKIIGCKDTFTICYYGIKYFGQYIFGKKYG